MWWWKKGELKREIEKLLLLIVNFSTSSVVIENCIICDGAEIKKGAILKSCLIGPSYVVAEGASHEKQHLGEADEFMKIE